MQELNSWYQSSWLYDLSFFCLWGPEEESVTNNHVIAEVFYNEFLNIVLTGRILKRFISSPTKQISLDFKSYYFDKICVDKSP